MSSIMTDLGLAWVRVRGIPLHLQSEELFQSISDFCGGFLCSKESLDLSFVRIKVRTADVIPQEVLICFGSEVFPVQIEAEAVAPLSPERSEATFLKGWKAKGKGVFVRVATHPPPCLVMSATSLSLMVLKVKRLPLGERVSVGKRAAQK
ncbi:hypothetical protein LINGRAHAP2_LOCUS14328 [Linum grandiflorum]